jgi:quercetin dioxygenase-like cupin family protein
MPSAKKKSRRSQIKSASRLKSTVSRQSARPTGVQYTPWTSVPLEEVHPLFHRQFVVGQEIMLARILLKKGFVVPEHSHQNEQLTYILDGALKFWIDGKEIVVRAGETLCIPSNVPHKAEALEDTIDLDIFSPPRADWINKTDQYLRKK